MLQCQVCGNLISTFDAKVAAKVATDGNKTLCPSCAVALYYERQHGAGEQPAHLTQPEPHP